MTKIEDAIRKLQIAHAPGVATQRLTEPPASPPAGARESSAELPSGRLQSANSIVVTFDVDRLRSAGYIGSDQDQRLLADQYRIIKWPLLKTALDPRGAGIVDGNFVQLTSAIANEGKTFTCLHLALSIAQEQDVSVLLIDADVVNPRLSVTLGMQEQPGLLDFLADDQLRVEDVIYQTTRPSLLLMPAGRPRPNTAELLASARMDDLLAQAVRRYKGQVVVADSAPVTLTSESRVLASRAGQIVLVVRAGTTPREVVLQAIEAIGEEKPLNLVLNGVVSQAVEGSYSAYGNYAGGSFADNVDGPDEQS